MSLKKSNLIAIVLALLSINQYAFASIDYSRIRSLETEQQFEDAVKGGKVLMNLSKDMVINKEGDSNYAKRRLEAVIPMRSHDSKMDKDLVVRCDIMVETEAKKVTLTSTNKANQQMILKSRKKIGESMERWTMSKGDGREVTLTCTSYEMNGDKTTKVALVPVLVEKVLNTVSGTLVTSYVPDTTAETSVAPVVPNSSSR